MYVRGSAVDDNRNTMTMSETVCFVVGARPNFMKVAPVCRAFGEIAGDVDQLLVHTGQHYDDSMSTVFIDELGLRTPDVFLGVGSGRHGEQTASALVAVERVLVEHSPGLVVVAGDVNSTLAAALAAVKLGIPVAHIESGLRSFDWTMPEEHNRKLTDHLSSLLFAHSPNAIENLRAEGIEGERVQLVGNTMIDSVFQCLAGAKAAQPWTRFGLEEQGYALVTLHRPGLVDVPELLGETIAGLRRLAAEVPVLFPVHPRTRARITELGLASDDLDGRFLLTEPLGYLSFLGLEACAKLVLTDSGGVQEETSALGVPCFTLRDSTERPITVTDGTNTLLGARPELIASIPQRLGAVSTPTIQLWDGHAGARTAEILRTFMSGNLHRRHA